MPLTKAAAKPHRDTILVEDAEVVSQQAFPGDQYVLRVHAPRIATRAQPGSFAHVRCDPLLPMRRPLSIMRVGPEAGWVDFLYKAFGAGTGLLAQRKAGEHISLIGPIGVPFQSEPGRPRALLIGGGVGIPPMIFLAEHLRAAGGYQPFVLMGSEVPFPFTARPSQIMIPGMPEGVIAAMPLMEDWKIPSRLASKQGYAGCFDGYVPALAHHWLSTLDAQARAEVAIYACGPHPMLEATAGVAAAFDVPCQVSLEEFMACAVGGCAGCVVEVQTPNGPAMKRVCVDGPVFSARSVFPRAYA